MNLPDLQPEEAATLERVLDAAEALFVDHRFSGVSMDMVAARLGMSKKTLYRYFHSKGELERATVDRFFAQAREAITVALEEAGTTRAKLTAFFSVVASRLSRVNLSAVESLEFRNPELWDHLNRGREQMIRTKLGSIIIEAQRSGELREDLSADFMVGVLVTLVQNMATPSQLMRYPGGLGRFTSDLLTLLLDGMAGPTYASHIEEEHT